jgi:hypothetical protein
MSDNADLLAGYPIWRYNPCLARPLLNAYKARWGFGSAAGEIAAPGHIFGQAYISL